MTTTRKMRTTRNLVSVLLGAAVLLCLGTARAQEAPDVLVKNVTLEVVELIAKDKEIKSGNRAKLVQVIDAKVLPHFNFNAMTALALGQNWNKATPEQKKRLTEEFRTLLVRTYASALAAYSEQKLDFRPLRAKPGDTDVTVQVRVLQQGARPVPIDYAMEKTSNGWKVYDVMVGGVSLVANYRTEVSNRVRVLQKGAQPVPIDYAMEKTSNGWKVYDVMVGGVSLVANYRTEFSNVVRESGIDGLIKTPATKTRGRAAAETK